jgi:molybdenum cofactor cytidylyltransferase
MAKLAAIVLAAGGSTRFGADNKLLARLPDGRAVVRCVVDALIAGGIADVVVVTGYEAERIAETLAGLPVRFVENNEWQTGMGSSIAAGAQALSEEVAGAFVVPGDMPYLSADLLRNLVAAFDARDRPFVVYPALADGAQRNPVLWPRSFFPQLSALSGPKGAKALLQSLGDRCIAVRVHDAMQLADIDTAADLAARS